MPPKIARSQIRRKKKKTLKSVLEPEKLKQPVILDSDPEEGNLLLVTNVIASAVCTSNSELCGERIRVFSEV